MQFTIKTVAFMASLTCFQIANAADFYVAPTGKNSNVGTLAAPFKTIQAAVDKAQAGDNVIVRAGVYRESVVAPRSGMPGKPITFKTFAKERVVISGTEIVSGWKASGGKIYSAPMAADFYKSRVNYANQIFVDGQMINQARWPNTSLDVSRPTKSTITKFISKTRDDKAKYTTAVFEDDNLLPKTDGYYVGCEITIQPNKDAWSWILSGVVIAQKGNILTIRSRSDMGKDGKQEVYENGSRYWIYNARKLLDSNGEWFHNARDRVLDVQFPDGGAPAKRVVEARKRDFAFDLTGKSYLVVQGFNLFACTLTSDLGGMGDGVGYDENGNDRYPWRSPGTTPEAHHIVLDGLNVRYPSHFTDVSGHFFYQHGMSSGVVLAGVNNVIQNSRVQFSAGNGIALYGRENKALNNIIEDANYSATECAGINTLGGGIDSEIAFNTIRRTGRSGMTIRDMANSDERKLVARVHHNDISEFMLQDWDGGGIYTATQDAKFVRIDHNVIHDAVGHTVSGIYPDFAKNWIIDHNLIYNVDWAIHLEGAHTSGVINAIVFNNTAFSRDQFIGIGNGQAPGSFYFNNLHNQNIGKAADGAREIGGVRQILNNLQWDNRANSPTDPKFVSTATGNWSLQADSPARDKGRVLDVVSTFQPGNADILVKLPFTIPKDGKPDLGAFEFGEPIWKVGSTLAEGVKAPVAPRSLKAFAPAATRVNLSWSDSSENETGFAIERKSGASAWKRIGVVSTNATEYYDNGLGKGTAYSYRVAALNSAGASGFSALANVTTPAVSKTDARISSTRSAPKIDGNIDAVWNAAPGFSIANVLGGTFKSDVELSGNWRALWDATNLYVLIDARDATVLSDAKSAWYAVSSAEIYLDANDSKKAAYDHINDFQIAFGADKGTLNFGANSARDKMTFPYSVVKTVGGYRVEAAIPWSDVLGYSPKAGALIGFDVHLTAVKKTADGALAWKGKKTWHSKTNDSWFDPRMNATVELVAGK